MLSLVKKRNSSFGRKWIVLAVIMVSFLYCSNFVQAQTNYSAKLVTDRLKGTCTYTVGGIDTNLEHEMLVEVSYMNTTSEEDGEEEEIKVLEQKVELNQQNCNDGTYTGSFSIKDLKNFVYGEYNVKFYIGKYQELVVPTEVCDFSVHANDFVVEADENNSDSTRTITLTPAEQVVEPTIPLEGNKLILSIWRADADESTALVVGEEKEFKKETLTWTIDNSIMLLDYGKYMAKLSVVNKELGEGQYKIATTEFDVGATCSSFEVKKTAALEKEGAFGVYLNDVKNKDGVKKVVFLVYNSKNKQVYTATATNVNGDGSCYYKAIKMDKLNYVMDRYTIKACITDEKGITHTMEATCVADQSIGNGTLTVTNSKDKVVKFKLKGAYIPGKIKEVKFTVFTKTGGSSKSQDYIASYTKSSDTYTATMKISEFKYRKSGIYNVYAYGTSSAGKKILLGKKTFEIATVKTTLKGKVKSSAKGQFVINTGKIDTPAGVSSVTVKVWGNNQSSDGYSYKATKQKNGTYQVLVDVKNHNYYFGTYNAKVYVALGNGIKVLAASCQYIFKPVNFIRFEEKDENHIRCFYIYNPSKSGAITVDVYSKVKGTDDLVSYKMKKSGSGFVAKINMSKIKHAGVVYIKVKVGGTVIKNYSYNMKSTELVKNGWIYENYNGKKYKFFYENGEKLTDLTKKLGLSYSSDSNVNKFYIEINRAASCVTIYAYNKETGKYDIPVKTCAVSVGRDTWTVAGSSGLKEESSYTPIGQYSICTNGYGVKYSVKPMVEPDKSVVYARWASHIVGNVYFHAIAVGSDSHYALNPNHYNKLGSPASAGCIRMTVRDAKWIYDYASKGSIVNIVKGSSSNPGPLGKPKTIKISSSIHYDPTDPEVPDSRKAADFKAGKISGYIKKDGTQVWK